MRSRLNVAHPLYEFPTVRVFSATAVGLDADKLGYFGLSVIWRAAVHSWRLPFGGQTKPIDFRIAEDSARKYLLGEIPFPKDLAVIVHACNDYASAHSFQMPSQAMRNVFDNLLKGFGFQALGVDFLVLTGNPLPPQVREYCCMQSDARLIFQRDCEQKTMDAFSALLATSSKSRRMQ